MFNKRNYYNSCLQKKTKREPVPLNHATVFVTQSNLNKSLNIIDIYRYRTMLNIRAVNFVAVTISLPQRDHDIVR